MKSGKSHFVPLMGVVLLTLFFATACGPQLPRSAEKQSKSKGWIGVYVQDLDRELRGYLGLDVRNGVLVNDVVAGSPAEDAGLQEEDVIIKFDGKTIRKTRDLTRAVSRKRPGDRVKVEIIRDGEKEKLKLRIEERPEKMLTGNRRFRPPKPPRLPHAFSFRTGRAWLGIRMADLNNDLADYFDVDENEGVLVLSVMEDSPADEAGLKAGDVIVKVDEEKIRGETDLLDILADKEPGDEVEIVVKRKGREMTLKAELERTYRHSSFRFNFDNDDMLQWKHEMNEWQDELKHELNMDFEHRIRIEIPLQQFGAELERELEGLGEELEKEMEKLKLDLENLDIRIHIDDPDETV